MDLLLTWLKWHSFDERWALAETCIKLWTSSSRYSTPQWVAKRGAEKRSSTEFLPHTTPRLWGSLTKRPERHIQFKANHSRPYRGVVGSARRLKVPKELIRLVSYLNSVENLRVSGLTAVIVWPQWTFMSSMCGAVGSEPCIKAHPKRNKPERGGGVKRISPRGPCG